ncbi:hypothetical protein E8E11_000162 [Didymella keratinophila]|nr:hypothetical protein E8E11_000162 [Didymella keratinophila]
MTQPVRRSSTFTRALDDFKTKLRGKEFSVTAVDGRVYVLVDKLQKWLRAPAGSDSPEYRSATNIHLLAHAAHFGSCDSGAFSPLPREPASIAEPGRNCCLLVFSILLDLDRGGLLDTFAHHDIRDKGLPIALSELKHKLRNIEDGDQIANEFNARQWSFCPAYFSEHMDEGYFEDHIIPVCRTQKINSGGTADVWQICVQREFVDAHLRRQLEGDAHASYEDLEYGHCYLFALKVFRETKFHHFQNEKMAFDGLRNVRGLISRLGCYSHKSPMKSATLNGQPKETFLPANGKTTKNLLLEYGTYDLRLIFGHQTPPMIPAETIAFWEGLFEVASAVSEIHDFKHGGNEFNGWHADIKPENIIFVCDKYKLADPGFACFRKKSKEPRVHLRGGTDTYGAPEVYEEKVHQTIDTWSLGCVFSMAATWVVAGLQGVHQYHQVRERALSGLLQTIGPNGHPLLKSQGLLPDGIPDKLDCFHDGITVLSEVTGWHTFIKNSCRKTDPITTKIIGLVDKCMLLPNPQDRIKSGLLCEELAKIVGEAKQELSESIDGESLEVKSQRERLEDLLKEIDEEAEMQAVKDPPPEPKPTHAFTKGLPVDRGALKAQISHLALKKTSHRLESRTQPRSRPSSMVAPPIVVTPDTTATNMPQSSQSPHTQMFASLANDRQSMEYSPRPENSSRASTTGSISRRPTGLSRKASTMPHNEATQNVIQVRESIERERKRSRTFLPRRSLKKDEILSRYFKNRDIKFLVDDAGSMYEHWDAATYLLETLALKAHGQDPDGPDLAFTNDSNKGLERVKDATDLRKKMLEVKPMVFTNMKRALEPIFQSYVSVINRTSNKTLAKSLTVIILTDGLWEGMSDPNEITTAIMGWYEQLKTAMKGFLRDRQISIQFIQFGDDATATERLRRLDDDTPFRGVPDIIDHERFIISGDIYKMLLGSFVEEMDAIDDDDGQVSSPDGSPPPHATGPILSHSMASIDRQLHLDRRQSSSAGHM